MSIFFETIVISLMAHNRDGEAGWGGADGKGVWEARGRLNISLGLFGLAMGPTSASHRPEQA